jgi:hypothetical protein
MIRKNVSYSLRRGRVARLLSILLMNKGHRATYRDYILISTLTEGYILLD